MRADERLAAHTRSDKEPLTGLFHFKILARYPELKVRVDQSFDCSGLSPSAGSLSPLLILPPSLASRSNTPVPPNSLSRQTRRFPSSRLSLPSSFPSLSLWCFVFTSQAHFSPFSLGLCSFPLPCFAVCCLFPPHLPSAASSRSSSLISFLLSAVQIFCFSFHYFTCSLYPPLLRSL